MRSPISQCCDSSSQAAHWHITVPISQSKFAKLLCAINKWGIPELHCKCMPSLGSKHYPSLGFDIKYVLYKFRVVSFFLCTSRSLVCSTTAITHEFQLPRQTHSSRNSPDTHHLRCQALFCISYLTFQCSQGKVLEHLVQLLRLHWALHLRQSSTSSRLQKQGTHFSTWQHIKWILFFSTSSN